MNEQTPASAVPEQVRDSLNQALRQDVQYSGRTRLATVLSSFYDGLTGYLCEVEVCLMQGLPYFDLVGSGDKTLRDVANRVKAALRMSGFTYPDTRIVVNISPAWLAKRGSTFDLPIALGILLASGQLTSGREIRAFGELALDGSVKPVPGAYLLARTLNEGSAEPCLVPYENRRETDYFGDARSLPCRSLQEACHLITGGQVVEQELEPPAQTLVTTSIPDLSVLKGQSLAIEALTVAAAGGHHMMMFGSAGCGKTTLAAGLPGILPKLRVDEQREVAAIYSVAGQLMDAELDFAVAPFRSPHFSTTPQALFGGGQYPRPGEVSLAHRGVLFLDELTAFTTQSLTRLLKPLEDGEVEITRMKQVVRYPAAFQLVAAANPCPCGKLLDGGCRCPEGEIRRYRRKIIGPFRDRIDIQISMLRVPQDELADTVRSPERSLNDDLRQRVERARQLQWERHRRAGLGEILNTEVPGERLAEVWAIDDEVLNYSELLAARLNLSVRSFQKLLRVARTLADLDERSTLRKEDLALAAHFRNTGEEET